MSASPSRHTGSRVWIFAAVLAVAGLALCILLFLCQFWYAPAAPAVDLTGVDPAVASEVREARQDVSASPRSAKAWGFLAMVLLANGFIPDAQVCLSRAEQLDPEDPRWPYFQSGINRWTNPQAGDKLRRAVELCGDQPPTPRLRLAEWLLSRGRLEEAEEEFNRSLAAIPDDPWARLGLARAALERGDPAAALARLDEHPRQTASVVDVLPHAYHELRAKIYERMGDAKSAAAEARAPQTLPPDLEAPDSFAAELEPLAAGLQAKTQLADRQLKEGRFADALGLLQSLARDYPDDAGVWLRSARLFQARGDQAGAEQAARKAAALAPTSVDTVYFLGAVLFGEGKAVEAAGLFRRTTELEPAYAPGYLALGQCLDKEGDRAAAVATLRAAVRYSPQVAVAHRALGELLAQTGRKDEAAVCLRNALRLDPDDPQAQALLERLDNPHPMPEMK